MNGVTVKERSEALTIVLRGGVPIEDETEESEIKARIVYDWLVNQKEECDRIMSGEVTVV